MPEDSNINFLLSFEFGLGFKLVKQKLIPSAIEESNRACASRAQEKHFAFHSFLSVFSTFSNFTRKSPSHIIKVGFVFSSSL
jgi:hypothetical protein